MKKLFSSILILLSLASTSAIARGNYCIDATKNLANIHANLGSDYNELAYLMETHGSGDRIRSVQFRIVNGNNQLPGAQQAFNQYCSR